jgi:hypothetical protein
MSNPQVNQTFTDGALGVTGPSTKNVQALVGVCSAGTPNAVGSYGDAKSMQTALGRGALVECAAQALKAGPVMVVPVTPSTLSSVGSTTQVGSGAGTVTVGKALDRTIDVKIVLGGAVGVATFQVRIGTTAYGPTTLTAAAIRCPGAPLVMLNFSAGTYVAADVYSFALDGTITRVGSGTATLLNTSTFEALDAYQVAVRITTAGALGVAVFQYSLDGGDNYSAPTLVPGAGVYVIPNSGIKLTFASTFVAGDIYTAAVVGPSCSNSDVVTALNALKADPRTWFMVHVVVLPTSAANSASLAAAVDAILSAMEGVFRYVGGLVECPKDDDIGGANTDATALTAFASYGNTRMSVALGDVELVSLLTGRQERRNVAWPYAARLASIAPGEDAGWIGRGPLPGVAALLRDEAATPGMNDQRFVTATTMIGKQGYFITEPKTMAPTGSDFYLMQFRRIIDIVATTARAALLQYLNQSVRILQGTGFIDPRDADAIEAKVVAQIKAAIVATGDASSVTFKLNRQINLLSTSDQPTTTRVVPLAYLKHITNDIGMLNPALAA